MVAAGSGWGEISAFKTKQDALDEVERCKRNDLNDGFNAKYEYRITEIRLY